MCNFVSNIFKAKEQWQRTISRSCDKSYYIFLVTGIGILLVLQATFNMLVAVGIMPVTGQPLPLISKGGTSTLVNCVYIGMILSISRYVNDLKRQQAEELLAQQTEQSQEIAPENNIIP